MKAIYRARDLAVIFSFTPRTCTEWIHSGVFGESFELNGAAYVTFISLA